MSKSNTQTTENPETTQATTQTTENPETTQATTQTRRAKTKIDPGEEEVEMFIPRKSREDTERFLAVNGENVLVKTDIKVKVKRKFKEVYENSVAQEAAAEEFIVNNINE